MTWHPLEPTDRTIFTSAPQLYRFPIRLAVPPARVWESLQSDESVKAWGMGVPALRWTSPRPFGPGVTREVVLPLHVATLRERFFRWDEGSGYSFCVVECNRPFFRRFAEDYVVEADGSGTVLTWTIAIEPVAPLARLMAAAGPLNRLAFGRFAVGAKRYFADRL